MKRIALFLLAFLASPAQAQWANRVRDTPAGNQVLSGFSALTGTFSTLSTLGSGEVLRKTGASGVSFNDLNVPHVADHTYYSNLAAPHPAITQLGDRIQIGDAIGMSMASTSQAYTDLANILGTNLSMGWMPRDATVNLVNQGQIGYSVVKNNFLINGNNPLFRSAFGFTAGVDCAYDAGVSGTTACESYYGEVVRRSQYATAIGMELAVANAYGPATTVGPYASNYQDSTLGINCDTHNSTEALTFYAPQSCLVIASAHRPGFYAPINITAHAVYGTNGRQNYTINVTYTNGSKTAQLDAGANIDMIQGGQYVAVAAPPFVSTVAGYNPTTKALILSDNFTGASGTYSTEFQNRQGNAIQLSTGSKGHAIFGANTDQSQAWFIRGDFATPASTGLGMIFSQFGLYFVSTDGLDTEKAHLLNTGDWSGRGGDFTGQIKAEGAGNTWPTLDANGAAWGPRDSWAFSKAGNGRIAIAGFSRSSNTVSPYKDTIGAAGFAIADNAGMPAWGLYGDCQFETGTQCYGLELAVKNKGANVTSTPYFMTTGTYGIWLPGGGDNAYGGASTNPNNTAIAIGHGGNTWNRGIVFAANALTGDDGVTGTAVAIEMAKGHIVSWRAPGNVQGSSIRSDVTGAGGSDVSQVFGDNKVSFYGSGGVLTMLSVNSVASAANYLTTTNAIAGAPPTIAVAGTDADIDIRLDPKGTGVVDFFYAATAATCTHTKYLSVKIDGVSRKMMLCD